ncbi:uncharacterized protein [Pseudorasbora parva]|uniref:uncharacterized protein n=1 Tax=Pseudorasbora parva TaxID=51549 RepID=UPI00351DF83B
MNIFVSALLHFSAPEKTTSVQISTSTIHPFTNTSSDHYSTAQEKTRPVQISTSTIHPFTNTSTAPETTRPVQISTSTIHPFTNTSTGQGIHKPIYKYICFVVMAFLHFSAPETTRPVQISTSTIHPFTTTSSDHTSTDLVSVVVGLGSALLVLTLCSGVFLILKKRKCGTALFQQNVQLNTETDHVYEEIPNSDVTVVTSSSNQTPASSANQMSPSHLNTRPKVSNIKPPEATQDSGTELVYTKATHPQNITTEKGPIYSVIYIINN